MISRHRHLVLLLEGWRLIAILMTWVARALHLRLLWHHILLLARRKGHVVVATLEIVLVVEILVVVVALVVSLVGILVRIELTVALVLEVVLLRHVVLELLLGHWLLLLVLPLWHKSRLVWSRLHSRVERLAIHQSLLRWLECWILSWCWCERRNLRWVEIECRPCHLHRASGSKWISRICCRWLWLSCRLWL